MTAVTASGLAGAAAAAAAAAGAGGAGSSRWTRTEADGASVGRLGSWCRRTTAGKNHAGSIAVRVLVTPVGRPCIVFPRPLDPPSVRSPCHAPTYVLTAVISVPPRSMGLPYCPDGPASHGGQQGAAGFRASPPAPTAAVAVSNSENIRLSWNTRNAGFLA